jgi:ribosomal protein L11 methyltransferase
MDKDYVCEDWGSESEWTQIKVTVPLEQRDATADVMSMISNYLQIEDYSDIDLKTCYGDLIDESILNADKTIASVSVYLPVERDIREDVEFLREMLKKDGIVGEIKMIGLNEEDWANAWKAYYKPIKIGSKIVIVPAWEKYQAEEHELVVRMDPGMAFGTGTHETTRLVMKIMQDVVRGGERVLDVGCGSGILAITASKLGAKSCNAYDIDPVAVKVAKENAKIAGCDNITVGTSDLLAGVERIHGGYELCVANIVADIIIRMLPDVHAYLSPSAPIILSGIVAEREDDIKNAAAKHGYSVVRIERENDWVAMMIRRGI